MKKMSIQHINYSSANVQVNLSRSSVESTTQVSICSTTLLFMGSWRVATMHGVIMEMGSQKLFLSKASGINFGPHHCVQLIEIFSTI